MSGHYDNRFDRAGSPYDHEPPRDYPTPHSGSTQDIPMHSVNPGYRDAHQEPTADYDDHQDLRYRHGNRDPDLDTPVRPHHGDYMRDYSGPIELSALPSRQMVPTADSAGVSHHSIRRRKSRRHPGYGTIRWRQGFDQAQADYIADEMAGTMETGEEPEMAIKNMATSMKTKKQIRSRLQSSSKRKERGLGYFTRAKYAIALSWLHTKQHFNNATYSFELWRSHLKTIESHFGTGVTSYFLFLKALFLLNWPIFLLTFGFVVTPQIVFRYLQQSPPGYGTNATFDGREIITGGGFFRNTELHYGYYYNGTISVLNTGLVYNMQYAYLLTSGGYYLLCLIIVAYSLTQSYKKNLIEASGASHFFSVDKVLCGWDYTITAAESARLQQKSILKELQEHLSTLRKDKKKKTLAQLCGLVLLRILLNVVVLGLLGGAGYLLWYISDAQLLRTEVPVLSEMALPLTVSAINFILPLIFSIICTFERFENPNIELFLTMVRTMVLKGVTLGVLIVFWYRSVPCTLPNAGQKCKKCWETYMGEQIYRLVMVDFFFLLGITFFTEFIRRLIGQCWKGIGSPEFSIARNTLSLIYSQALCWLGTFYSPLLSFITIIKFFIVFYVKRVSVMQNCRPAAKPWRGGRAHTFFLAMLFLAYLMTSVAVFTAIATIKPSISCGPYRGLESSYSVLRQLFTGLEGRYTWLRYIVDLVTSTGSIAFIVAVLCVVAYYCRIISLGHYEMVALLKHQLTLEGKDKVFLLHMLQEASKNKTPNKKTETPVSNQMPGSSAVASGGKAFAKTQADKRKNEKGSKDDVNRSTTNLSPVTLSSPTQHPSHSSYNAGYHDNSLETKPYIADLQPLPDFNRSGDIRPQDYSFDQRNLGYSDDSPPHMPPMTQKFGVHRGSKDNIRSRSASPEKGHKKRNKGK